MGFLPDTMESSSFRRMTENPPPAMFTQTVRNSRVVGLFRCGPRSLRTRGRDYMSTFSGVSISLESIVSRSGVGRLPDKPDTGQQKDDRHHRSPHPHRRPEDHVYQ